jgi:hypothetical protein
MAELLDGIAMRCKAFLVYSSRHPICAAKSDRIDEQSARYRASKCLASTHDVEIWEGDRLIAVFRPLGTSGQLGAERHRLHCSSGA